MDRFRENEEGEFECLRCGSTQVALVPKMFATYCVCLVCGNEDRD